MLQGDARATVLDRHPATAVPHRALLTVTMTVKLVPQCLPQGQNLMLLQHDERVNQSV